MRQTTGIDELLIAGPLLLKLLERRGIDNRAAGTELVNLDIDQELPPSANAKKISPPEKGEGRSEGVAPGRYWPRLGSSAYFPSWNL
jgi:hypothetical protein